MASEQVTTEIATWAHFAIVVFCIAAAAAFLTVSTRKLWAGARAPLVVGSAARIAFVVGTFAVLVVVALAVCDLAVGVEARKTLNWSLGSVSVYIGALLGFHAAMRLEPVTQALLGTRGAAKHEPEPPAFGAKGLRRIAPVPGELCWTCGETKTSPKHLAGCPAGKEGAT